MNEQNNTVVEPRGYNDSPTIITHKLGLFQIMNP